MGGCGEFCGGYSELLEGAEDPAGGSSDSDSGQVAKHAALCIFLYNDVPTPLKRAKMVPVGSHLDVDRSVTSFVHQLSP